ncbi:hypothetical protein HK097_004648 [Rhizophlyctis rosea]|uniref:Uncharacterized protein n=1 Tax=Rhizophlyctis rosea TaxID=64517 RepID=A0AAD5WWM7_9FUNG|nr:hypothetical protein HK097_004648 [Rhizophlyctis rosea]
MSVHSTAHLLPHQNPAISAALPPASLASLAYTLGLTALTSSTSTPQTDAQAFAYFYSAANHGHPDAAFRLATMYASGRGLPPRSVNRADAFNDDNVRYSMSTVSETTLNGSPGGGGFMMGGVGEPNPAAAIAWYKRAVEGGSVDAMCELGVAHLLAWGGLGRDDREGVRLLKVAFEKGKKEAGCYLGWAYVREWEGFVGGEAGDVDVDPMELSTFLTITLDSVEEIVRTLAVPAVEGVPDSFTFEPSATILTPALDKGLHYLLRLGVERDVVRSEQWVVVARGLEEVERLPKRGGVEDRIKEIGYEFVEWVAGNAEDGPVVEWGEASGSGSGSDS